ncbi:MAG: FAD-binding protein [Deltaproteobacteria bacterium]|jgi:glycolate oxidase subunit GlcD|nr:FAD-binding protein [Deltaproteobacteria bacterium]
MLNAELIANLRQIVGGTRVSVSRAETELYSYDASLAKGQPGIVVFPADTREVARVVSVVRQAGLPFVPRGFGTNLSGGTVLVSGGVVICLSRLNRIIAMSPERRCAVVQPGVTNLELQNALAPLGFFYAPDPASQKVATLGGNVGENSGGPRCLKYGVTTNHILGMDVVLSSGEVIRLGGCAYDPPGYDLRGALIGSEGTMGIVTEVTVRILPLPEKIITLLVIYDDIGDAAQSVSDIVSAGILPTTLEMMDAPIINAVEDSYACGYPRDAAAVLIVEVEGLSAGLKDQVTRISQICRKNHCRDIREAKDDAQRNRLWEGRRGAFGAVARLAPNYLVNDCTVPRTKLPEALARVAEIVDRYDFKHGNVFHAGDGNLHPLIFFDARDADQLKRVKKAGWEIMKACVELGGTISGEHGVGLEKIEAMRLVFSELDFIAQRGLQQAFDPDGLLNPGKVIPLSLPEENTDEVRVHPPFAGADTLSAIEKEIGERIQSAAADGTGLIPAAGGGFWHFGNLPTRNCQKLSSSALNEILEFDPYNQFVTAGAGVRLDVLQRQLAEHHQWLPVRPSFCVQNHSLGAVMARAACGPERMHYGASRDLVLGLRFLDGNGQKISTGGKVVKNVAGYDMTRLMIGSAGTLGLITEVTCRVMTIPERCSAIGAQGPLSACADLASEIMTSQLIPVFIVIMPVNGQGEEAMRRRCTLKIGFEGFDKTVTEQLKRTQALFEKDGMTLSPAQDYAVQDGIFKKSYSQMLAAAFILRADLPLDRMPGFVESLARWLPQSKWFLDYGCGRIFVAFENMPDGLWGRMCETGDQLGGHVVMEKATDEFKKHNDVFGIDRPEWKVMHRIKAALDPQHVFSPGRLPGKI